MKITLDVSADELVGLISSCKVVHQFAVDGKIRHDEITKTLPGVIKKLHDSGVVELAAASSQGKMISRSFFAELQKKGFDKL